MTAPAPHVVDVEAVARRVVRDPRNARVSTIEQLALCQWTVDRIEAQPTPIEPEPIKASLAASLALAIAAYDHSQSLQADRFETGSMDRLEADLAFHDAFKTLKTRFEEEFPNV